MGREQRREALALAAVLVRYWLMLAPRVRRELRGWETRARAIPDAVLRGYALQKLREEGLNSEAAAAFATLAPRAHQATLVRLLVAFEVMYDFLDAVSEQPVADTLRNGCQLHLALAAPLHPRGGTVDYYRLNPQSDDGGYLDALVATCHQMLGRLPAATVVAPMATRAAARCGEGQSRAHAAPSAGVEQLADWSAAQARGGQSEWVELAAGAASSLCIHALFAAAADPGTTSEDAARIDAAYYPSICALSTLLDSLVDYSRDGVTSNHSFVAYYPSDVVAAEQLVAITTRALTAARGLPRGSRHAVIVAGIAGFYLSVASASSEFARPAARSVMDSLGPIFRPISAIVRLRRLLHGTRRFTGC